MCDCRKGAPCQKHLRDPQPWRPTTPSLPSIPETTPESPGHLYLIWDQSKEASLPDSEKEAPLSPEMSYVKLLSCSGFGNVSVVTPFDQESPTQTSISSSSDSRYAEDNTLRVAMARLRREWHGLLKAIALAVIQHTEKRSPTSPSPGKIQPTMHLLPDPDLNPGDAG